MKSHTTQHLLSDPKERNTLLLTSKNYVSQLWDKLHNLIKHCLVFLLQLFRPFLGPDQICPFTIGCTEYAILQLQKNNILKASYFIIKRLLSCNPFINIFKKI